MKAPVHEYRVREQWVLDYAGTVGDGTCGIFEFPRRDLDQPAGDVLRCQASTGAGWDHVSVSLPHRCPTWWEMDYVRRLFFRDRETAMQLHPPRSQHVNSHSYCLHLWRPQHGRIPGPPTELVG